MQEARAKRFPIAGVVMRDDGGSRTTGRIIVTILRALKIRKLFALRLLIATSTNNEHTSNL